ncbi:MAG: CoA transferase [Rhodospirillaceae bacterium]|jgi:crotonobetainyl-CoA:carnitine CoA-transferase CaiB-like acyl-CoA transferase|nr:CoA transferase [Rhodospirillaceae bacterium]
MPHHPASTALDHVRVLDLTRARSGPTAVRQLADWGADVIKIEPPGAIDPDGSVGSPRHTADFQNLHRNKRALTINLKEPEGLEIFLKLAATVDVVVENFRPDVKTRLGIDYAALKAVNPRIILASISGFGQTGPYAKRPGFDQIAQGMGGLMSITGEPGRGPMRVGIPIADLCTGLFTGLGILTALIERDKSGEGQWLHSSLLQSQLFMLDFQAARWLMSGEVAPQVGNDHPTNLPTGLFETKDGTVNISAAGDAIFGRLARALGHDSWIDDPDFAHNDDRFRNRDRMNALIQEKFSEKTTAEWVDQLTEAGVPCGPVYNIDEAFADPQVQHLGVAQPVDTVPFGETECVAQPIQLTRTPTGRPSAPPERGEHTDEILESLGYSAADIADFRERTIV